MSKRIQGYEILSSFYIGRKHIVLAKNETAPEDEVFLCGYLENKDFCETLTDCLVSDNYADVASVMGERITMEAQKVLSKLQAIREEIGDNPEITHYDTDKFIPVEIQDNLVGKVVVLTGSLLPHEYKTAAYQLVLCTGGFGAQPNARGRTCFVTRIYDGEKGSCYRQNIIGTIPDDKLPEWAKERLNKEKKEK